MATMIFRLGLLSVAAGTLLLAGCSPRDGSESATNGSSAETRTEVTMPDVVGARLDVALSDIERAGIDDEVEILGGGTFGVVIESNWHVCEQLPASGDAVQDSPRLTVERSCPDIVPQAQGTDPDSESAAAAEATAPTQPETSAPISAPSSTPTTEATTTVPAATTPPTTVYELSEDEMRALVFPIVFDTYRDGVIEILNGNFVVQTVDRYVYDSDNGTVLVDITPAFDFDEGVRDDAWEIMRAMSELWTVEAWVDPAHSWSPSLDVSISTAQYRCTGDQMRLMQDARFGRSDWEASCRVR